jgi:hypothetical protein
VFSFDRFTYSTVSDSLSRHDGKGTIVAELRPDSPLEGMLSPGDKLVAVSIGGRARLYHGKYLLTIPCVLVLSGRQQEC